MSRFQLRTTDAFSHKLESIRHRDPDGHKRILKVIDRLLLTPSDADGWMHGAWDGKLKKYVGRSDYRLIYQWCESCRRTQKCLEAHCGSCGDVDDHSVIFFDLYHKNEQSRHLRHFS